MQLKKIFGIAAIKIGNAAKKIGTAATKYRD